MNPNSRRSMSGVDGDRDADQRHGNDRPVQGVEIGHQKQDGGLDFGATSCATFTPAAPTVAPRLRRRVKTFNLHALNMGLMAPRLRSYRLDTLEQAARMPSFSITIPLLETDRLILREYRQTDFDAFAAFYETPRSGFIGGPMSRELAWRGLAAHLGHWALRGFGFWAVEEKATGSFCGHVGLWHPEGWPEPEVGWVLMSPAEGKGIALEAALAARRHAYRRLNWPTAISMIDPANTRSLRLAERMGCRHESGFTHVRLGVMQVWRHPAPDDLEGD